MHRPGHGIIKEKVAEADQSAQTWTWYYKRKSCRGRSKCTNLEVVSEKKKLLRQIKVHKPGHGIIKEKVAEADQSAQTWSWYYKRKSCRGRSKCTNLDMVL